MPSGGLDGHTLLDLGAIPLVNKYHETEDAAMRATKYPLHAKIQDDKTINLTVDVPPEILYSGYKYNSSVNTPYVGHCRRMFKRFSHLRHDTTIDIGGNDGTLLKTFQEEAEKPLRLINVDASESFKEVNEKAGIEYVNAFFSDELDLPKANVITSTNVFQQDRKSTRLNSSHT